MHSSIGDRTGARFAAQYGSNILFPNESFDMSRTSMRFEMDDIVKHFSFFSWFFRSILFMDLFSLHSNRLYVTHIQNDYYRY